MLSETKALVRYFEYFKDKKYSWLNSDAENKILNT